MSEAPDRTPGEVRREAGGEVAGPFSCVITGPGIDVRIHLDDGGSVGDMLRSLGDGLSQGLLAARLAEAPRMDPMAARGAGAAPAPSDLDATLEEDTLTSQISIFLDGVHPSVRARVLDRLRAASQHDAGAAAPAPARDPSLRFTVASDLRAMWDQMWDTGPRARETEGAREAAWSAWIASEPAQRIIDESLGDFGTQSDDPPSKRQEN